MVRKAFNLVADHLAEFKKAGSGPLSIKISTEIEQAVLWYGLLIVAMALLRGLFLFFMRQTIIVMSRYIEYDQKNDLYSHFQALPQAFYRKANTGDLMARISEDVGRVRMYTGPAIMYGINLIVLFAMVISYMISVSLEFTFYVLLPLPILSISIYFLNNHIEQRSDKIQKSLSRLSTFVQEVFSGIRVLKAFNKEEETVKAFAAESVQYSHESIQLGHINAWFSPIILGLIGASSILTVYVGGQQVIQGKITTGHIAEFLIYVNMLTWPVTSLGWVMSIAQRAAVSQGRINEYLQEENTIQSVENLKTEVKGDLVFDRVCFEYPESGVKALQNVSFSLKAGQSLGVVGTTGSGKSTLAKLISRLYDPTSGTIFLDGHPLPHYQVQHLRQQLGCVPQDVFLFSDTIKNNILFGKPEATSDELVEAAQKADLLANVMRFDKQFETVIGERGITLSGGQKQRVSIARALIRKPRLLILDDCLSAVDTQTENTILSHLKTEMAGKTSVIISHRISSVKLASYILVLDEGKVVQQGTHEELLAIAGPYRTMYEKQLLASQKEEWS